MTNNTKPTTEEAVPEFQTEESVNYVKPLEGPVSDEKAKEVNGYAGYDNIAEQIADDPRRRRETCKK